MSFVTKDLGKVLLVLVLAGWMGCSPEPVSHEKGPKPFLTEQAIQHIEARHIQSDLFQEKSKFQPGVDWKALVAESYEKSNSFFQEFDRYVYDYETGRLIGTKGQRRTRLVTKENGEVVTFYPRF